MLLNLLKKGHPELERKIGISPSFPNPISSKIQELLFFVVRKDDSVDDFSFRKCVDQIQPLPTNMQTKHYASRGKSGGGGGRGGGYGLRRGRGGRSRY
ncbi:hypothetical protein T459_14783 [Capsicum annuum]|uniref:Uncharacterized protein n=1 Tax=Capsicum annuum TaxID=4072 RepID=A0A2G2ZID8_CAPAN|nr:hypothetical protein T459_14783 [Capsicum annuum]